MRRLTCENDQAKLDRFSRLACSTLLSKILTTFRLSGAVWIEAQAVTPGRPRTYCAADFAFDRIYRRFCANFLKLSKIHLLVKVNRRSARSRSNSLWTVVPRLQLSISQAARCRSTHRAAQNIKERPAIHARADRARGRISPGSCNGLFSVGFPTGVQGRLPHLTQRTSFPLPSDGAGHTATGRLHCSSATL